MSIYLNADSKVIVQGITGGEGTKHTALMLKAGTKIVGGVNARKAGTTVSHGDVTLPVYGTVAEAVKETGATVSIVFVPPPFAKDAVIEAIDAGIELLVVITEGIPVQDSAEFWAYALEKGGNTRIIGPNCPGIITPGESLVGITPANITGKGPVGLVSKSGTLTVPDDVRAQGSRGSRPPSASAATRSSEPPTSTPSRRSRRTRTPRPS